MGCGWWRNQTTEASSQARFFLTKGTDGFGRGELERTLGNGLTVAPAEATYHVLDLGNYRRALPRVL